MIEERIFRVFLYVGAKNSAERTIHLETRQKKVLLTRELVSDTHDYIHVYT